MKFIDFFAGIGGFRRGLELAGHECVGFCEYDKFAVTSYTSMHLITDEQRKYLSTLDLNERQKEILKEEYRNGEWYSSDIRTVNAGNVPRADIWCFGAPCQDFSVAGARKGLKGDRSSLVREVFRILSEIEEENRPEWLIYENVKGMLSSNAGWDFFSILCEMDELGYDCEWQLFNSKDYGVPQNRERVYTVGHLRIRGTSKIFPIERTDGENNIHGVRQIGAMKSNRRKNPNPYRVYDTEGISPCLSQMDGGGREPHIIDLKYRIIEGDIRIYDNVSPTITGRDYKEPLRVAIPVLTPDRAEKRQNGRRFKEDGDEAFTLTAQDRHGVAEEVLPEGYEDEGGE